MNEPSSSAGPAGPFARGCEPVEWLDVRLAGVGENLALDEALLEAAHEGMLRGPIARVWMSEAPAVVVGASSRLSEEVDLDACTAAGATVHRRPSGGLSVVIGPGCLMWSLVWPAEATLPAIDAIHARVLDPLAAALRAAGPRVVRRGTSDLAVCAGGEERKVSGNALRVRRRACLYHGTMLDRFDLTLVERLLRHPPREPEYRGGRPHRAFVANLGLESAGRPDLETVRMRPRIAPATPAMASAPSPISASATSQAPNVSRGTCPASTSSTSRRASTSLGCRPPRRSPRSRSTSSDAVLSSGGGA